jgi:hypothetical protein
LEEAANSMKSDTVAATAKELSEPQGIGMAVAFDWGLAVQILVTPFLALVLGVPGYLSSFKQFNFSPPVTALISFLFSLPFAALCWVLGEGLRRGWHWTRPVQVALNSLLFFVGFTSLFSLWRGGRSGNYWSLVASIILLIFSPLIAWRLHQPATRQWFAAVNSTEARKRHGGVWPWLILLWAVVGGVLQALSTFYPAER